MGVTLNEIAYDIMDSIRGKLSDDDDLDIRQVKFWIRTQRAIWLRNEFNKNHTIDENFIQDLGCIDVELVDPTSCCSLSLPCKILRTTVEIPIAIELNDVQAITRVGPVNFMEKDFNYVSYNRAKYSGNNRFTLGATFAFLLNKRMYVFSKGNSTTVNMLSKINIRGVFENPEEVIGFNNCSGTPCYTADSSYPINAWLVDYIKGYILKNYYTLIMNQRADNVNDSTNTPPVIQQQ